MLKIIFLLSLFVGLSFLTYENKQSIIDYFKPPEKNTAKKRVSENPKVLVQNVQTISNDIIYKSIGSAKAKESADIYPTLSEQVSGIYFSAGDTAQKGELLVQLKDDEERVTKELATLQMQQSKIIFERNKKALQRNAISQLAYDETLNAYQKALLEVKKAQIALDKKRILAPFSGIVGITQVNVGDKVSPDTLITGIDNTALLFIDFDIPQSLLLPLNNAIANKENITLTSPSAQNQEFKGYFYAKQSRIDPTTRSIQARIALNNEQYSIPAGSSFEIVWKIKGKEYPYVPETALQWENEGSYVWVIKDDKAQKEYVKVVARKDGNILVEGDLNVKDQVVIEGVQRLKHGSSVTIVGKAK